MKRLVAGCAALGMVLIAVVVARPFSPPSPETSPAPGLRLQVEPGKNPWTHLRLNTDPSTFRFAVLADRTNAGRPAVFEHAIEQLNWLQPEFVLCVGDLIQGTTDETESLPRQWTEFHGLVSRLQMPFFYVPGNHDISCGATERLWRRQLGRRYYHFVYKGVLFLVLNSEEPPGGPGGLGSKQLEYVRGVLADNRDVRWTFVLLHRPIWTNAAVADTGWPQVEEALAGRPYSVFSGHEHRYQRSVRHGQRYYTLATTGGSSELRGRPFGEFDHLLWVTMKQDGPVLANLMLEGILPEDVR